MGSIQEFDEVSGEFCGDFREMLKLESEIEDKLGRDDDDEELDVKRLQQKENHDEESDEHDDDEDDDFEFSFAFTDRDGSPISADEIFSNGEIRPVFPLFNRDLVFSGESESTSDASSSSLRSPLRKIFVEKPSTSTDEKPIGEYCVWTGKTVLSSPDACKKSNSTGFSKLWRFRDLLHRSSSDGKDAFVFLHHSSPKPSISKPAQANDNAALKPLQRNGNAEKKSTVEARTERRVGGAGGKAAPSSAHEKHYVRNRAMKEGDRRRSYLPYRQDLVGFFTSVNGLSRNVHPY